MKIFISWSKEPSKAVAAALHEWLPLLSDDIKPWMSDKDIGSGQRGLVEIEDSLVDAGFGIVVITRANADNTWINFEAGALSKATRDTDLRVVPLLVDFERETDLQGPIAQMQCELLGRDGILELTKSLASVLGKPGIEKRFELVWPALEQLLSKIDLTPSPGQPTNEERDVRDIASEILTHVRELRRDIKLQPEPTATIGKAFARRQTPDPDPLAHYPKLRMRLTDLGLKVTGLHQNGRKLRVQVDGSVDFKKADAAHKLLAEEYGYEAVIVFSAPEVVVDPEDQETEGRQLTIREVLDNDSPEGTL